MEDAAVYIFLFLFTVSLSGIIAIIYSVFWQMRFHNEKGGSKVALYSIFGGCIAAIAGVIIGNWYAYYRIILPVEIRLEPGDSLSATQQTANVSASLVYIFLGWLIGIILGSIAGGMIGWRRSLKRLKRR
ncbi:hypothetical protein C7H19_21325 [Aphanothece hegewaldii CCALA 016]|uniref:Uncharacterized protein n=1 Tax=Aphanothece hegewaldii CCALA 016 TaxID=2107694 RepID=A0A2T1LSE1_9CHRO|nr:hypothetical protein [Aphanothece hegewaldii]PSF32669.1 hypothetical protein C7H19_21325 [Aphanothece hegewaldii CCALA 016]